MRDRLRVSWEPTEGGTVAFLHGRIDLSAMEVLVGVGLTAKERGRVIVDLTHVTDVDANGIVLLGTLVRVVNIGLVGIVNGPPDVHESLRQFERQDS